MQALALIVRPGGGAVDRRAERRRRASSCWRSSRPCGSRCGATSWWRRWASSSSTSSLSFAATRGARCHGGALRAAGGDARGVARPGLYIAAVTHTQEVAYADLLESEDRYRAVVDGMPCLTVRFTPHRRGALRQRPTLAGRRPAAPSGSSAPLRREWATVGGAVAADGTGVDHTWEVDGDGRRQWFTARLAPERLADGTIDGVVAVISDLTPAREAEAEAERERWTDPLTGLANRRRFFDLLGERAERPDGRALGVAMLDLDRFKGCQRAARPPRRRRRAAARHRPAAPRHRHRRHPRPPRRRRVRRRRPGGGPRRRWPAFGERLLTDVRIRVPVRRAPHPRHLQRRRRPSAAATRRPVGSCRTPRARSPRRKEGGRNRVDRVRGSPPHGPSPTARRGSL